MNQTYLDTARLLTQVALASRSTRNQIAKASAASNSSLGFGVPK